MEPQDLNAGEVTEQGAAQDSFFTPVASVDLWQETLEKAQSAGDSTTHVEHEQPQQGQQAQVEETQPQVDQGPQPRDLPEHISPEHAYGMATFQQSRADKALAQIAQMERELEAMKAANPIGQYAAQDPAFMAHVANYLSESSGGQSNGVAAGSTPVESPKKPVPPQRPANLDPYSEEGAAYQQQVLDYQQGLAEWQNSQLEAKLGQIEQYEQQKRADAERQALVGQIYNEAKYQYGFNDQQAAEFLQWVQDPNTANDMAIWANAFRMTKGYAPNGQANTSVQNPVVKGQIGRRVQQVQQTAAAVPSSAPAHDADKQESFFVQRANSRPTW